MRKVLLAFLAFVYIVPVGCSQGRNQIGARRTNNCPVEYAEEIMYLDSLRWLTGGPEYAKENTIDPDTLRMAWTGFAELYSRGKYEAAYYYLKAEQRYPNVLIYLRNSTAQYEFVSTVWNECVSAHAGSDEEYFKEIEDEYSLALLLTRTVVEMGGEEPYVPPHYMNMVMEFGQLILTMKDYERAETFDEEIYFAAKSMYGDERMARFLGLAFRCPYLCRVGREDQAHRELEAFRQKAERECSGEELGKLLSAVDATEKDMVKIN